MRQTYIGKGNITQSKPANYWGQSRQYCRSFYLPMFNKRVLSYANSNYDHLCYIASNVMMAIVTCK
jgi:hypothetical protein